MTFIVKLAGKNIKINSIHPQMKDFCKDYLTDEASIDFTITINAEDILFEKSQTSEQEFSDSYLETLSILRKISDILPSQHRFLMHGASISYDDKAYLFTAPSGTGKTTHIRLWKKYLGEKVKIVNGDKPFLSIENNTPIIYGSPWAGKERWHRNCSKPLSGICFVQRGLTNTIRRIKPDESLSLLFKQVYMPDDAAAAGHTLELLDSLVRNVPLYILECDMSEDAVRCSFETLTGLPYPSKTS